MASSRTGDDSVHFATISFAKVVQGDAHELATLHAAACRNGFFYLDLHETGTSSVLQDVQATYSSVGKFFALDSEDKIQFDIDEIGPYKLNGYEVRLYEFCSGLYAC
jgi:isopenicillin N synthase-like dioxygenase